MQAAKDEAAAAAAAAAALSEAPDSKIEEEEAELPTESTSEADVNETEEDDGIHMVFP